MHRGNSNLKVEFLEARMLLSAINLPQDVISAGVKDGAIDSSDSHVHVNMDASGQSLTITGPHDGNLTVNLDDLPASVSTLQVSSFDSVTLTGEHSFYSVILSNVGVADLGNASIGYALQAFGVEHIRIDTAPATILLAGVGGPTTIGDAILLEANHFSTSYDAFIFASVEKLGLETSSHVTSLPTIIAAANEPIFLNFQPDKAPDTNVREVSVVTGGDFAQYFFASSTDEAALEQSLVVSRHPVATNSVPLGSLLAEINLASYLPAGTEPDISQLAVHAHSFSQDNSAQAYMARALSESQNFHSTASFTATKLPFDVVAASVVAAEPSAHFNSASKAAFGEPIKLSAFGAFDPEAHPNEHFGEAVANALHALTSRLGQPFARLASDFGAGLATFGDLVAARFADHLKIDHQYALLVDARPVRPSDDREFLVVTI